MNLKNFSITMVVLFAGLFAGVAAHAQYSQERIALGTLEGSGMQQQTIKTPSGYDVTIEFMPSQKSEIQLSAFVSKNKKPVSGAMQVFIYTEQDIDSAFPKNWDPDGDKLLSKDGYIYLVESEDGLPGPTSNLAFIELNKNREIRISFLFGVNAGFRANGLFTEQWVNRKDPAGPKLVVTTDWISVD